MPNPLDAAYAQPAGAHMVAIERAASPVRLSSAAPTYRDTTSAIYPAKPRREEPRAVANRPVSAAFCDVPDPRYARIESMQSQISIGNPDTASVSDLDGARGGGSPKVGTMQLRLATAEEACGQWSTRTGEKETSQLLCGNAKCRCQRRTVRSRWGLSRRESA